MAERVVVNFRRWWVEVNFDLVRKWVRGRRTNWDDEDTDDAEKSVNTTRNK